MEVNKISSRKERERTFRRNEIISAAVKLFAEKGYEHTTLDEIAEASEFGKGTIYNYFQSKEEIYLAIVEDIMESQKEMIIEISAASGDLKDFLTQFTKAAINYSLENYDRFLLMARLRTMTTGFDPSIKAGIIQKSAEHSNKILFDKFNNAIKKKEIRHLDINSLINIYRSMVFPYLHFIMHCKKTEDVDPDKETEFIISVLFNGILAK